MNTKLPICTVGYLLRRGDTGEEIHFGKKARTEKAVKRKIADKLLGYGGDFESDKDRTIAESFARELKEESGFRAEPETLNVAAKILIRDEKGDRLTLYYVLVPQWTGQAGESREFTETGWFSAHNLPENILGADKLILPRILKGEKLEGFVEYDADMNVVNHNLATVAEIE